MVSLSQQKKTATLKLLSRSLIHFKIELFSILSVYVCKCDVFCICVCIYRNVHMCGGWRSVLSLFLYLALPYFSRQGFSLTLSLLLASILLSLFCQCSLLVFSPSIFSFYSRCTLLHIFFLTQVLGT